MGSNELDDVEKKVAERARDEVDDELASEE